jgi:peptidoglycan/LPS O-acetylase OafA/YrhL
MPPARRRPLSTRVGFALFGIGLVFVLVTVLPFFFHDHNRPLWLNLGCMLAPLGFVIAVTSVVRAGRAEQRTALAGTQADRDAERAP